MMTSYIYIAELRYPSSDIEDGISFKTKKALFEYYGEAVIGTTYKSYRNAWDTSPDPNMLETKYMTIRRYKLLCAKSPELQERQRIIEQTDDKDARPVDKAMARLQRILQSGGQIEL